MIYRFITNCRAGGRKEDRVAAMSAAVVEFSCIFVEGFPGFSRQLI
jgi:hypothetical protein